MQMITANEILPCAAEKRRRADLTILAAAILVIVGFGAFRSRHAGLIGLIAFTIFSTVVPVLLVLAVFWLTRLAIRSSAIARTVFFALYAAILYFSYSGVR